MSFVRGAYAVAGPEFPVSVAFLKNAASLPHRRAWTVGLILVAVTATGEGYSNLPHTMTDITASATMSL
jgi:hypothetical protein